MTDTLRAPSTSAGRGGRPITSAVVRPTGIGIGGLVCAVVALVVSVALSLLAGLSIAPMEEQYGRTLIDTPQWFVQSMLLVGVGQCVLTLLGLTALVLGVVAAVLDRGRSVGIVAAVIALIAPFLSFTVFVVANVLSVG